MYQRPEEVTAPQKNWRIANVEFSTGRGTPDQPGWAVARGFWNDEPAVGIRWNGVDGEAGPGQPQSRGIPTWLMLPKELEQPVLAAVAKLREDRDGILCEVSSPDGYDEGAWRVTIKLSDAKRKLAGEGFAFPYPRMDKRMAVGDTGYVGTRNVETGLERCGVFVKGEWRGHLYAYDVHAKNEAIANEIREAFVVSVNRELVDSREPNLGP